MTSTSRIEKLAAEIHRKFDPISVFLYGSRARGDFLKTSDYEVGVLFSKDKKISRAELDKFNPLRSQFGWVNSLAFRR